MLLGGASGFTLAAAFAAVRRAGARRGSSPAGRSSSRCSASPSRVASLVRNARLRPKSTLQTAIGIKHPRIVQKSQGFMGGSFNTREFFHGRPTIGAAAASSGRSCSPRSPSRWCCSPSAGRARRRRCCSLAFVVQYLGLLAERWFFFAQANHPQNLYYQAVA